LPSKRLANRALPAKRLTDNVFLAEDIAFAQAVRCRTGKNCRAAIAIGRDLPYLGGFRWPLTPTGSRRDELA
jgi:hypothetical protein